MDIFNALNLEVNKYSDAIFISKDRVDQDLPMHHHPKSQMLIVENGVANLKTNSATYYVPSRHYIWIPLNVEHVVEFKTGGVIIKTIYFNNEDDVAHPFYGNTGIYTINKLLQEMLNLTQNWSGNILKGDWQHEFLLTIKHLLPRITSNTINIVLPTTKHTKLLPLLNYVAINLENNLSITFVADKFGFSVRNLTRIFDKELHLSYLQYLKVLRVIKAIELLTSANKNVTETAYMVGYNSIAVFSNVFEEIVHIRPKDFQRLHSN